MSSRADLRARLVLLDELSGIFRALRSFALAELHRVSSRQQAQREALAVVDQAFAPLSALLPAAPDPARDRWILLGSVRGFCGSLNEEVVDAWQRAGGSACPTIAVGERLAAAIPVDAQLSPVPGASGGLDASDAIDRMLAALPDDPLPAGGLLLCAHGEAGVAVRRLWPPQPSPTGAQYPPLANQPLPQLAAELARHMLYHALLEALLDSIRVENRRRLQQMDNALHHLDASTDALVLRRNRLRQEAIVEEIEVMGGLQPPSER